MEGGCETRETRCGGHQELPWYLCGIKDPPIAPFLMSSSPTLPFVVLVLITSDYVFYIRARNHEIKRAFHSRGDIYIDNKWSYMQRFERQSIIIQRNKYDIKLKIKNF